VSAKRSGAILAAGAGSRLARDGWPMAKPMIPIAGIPLVEHAMANLTAAGVDEISVIFNAEGESCAAFLRERFAGLSPRILVKTTASSLESFREISRLAGPGPLLVTTVDAFCAPAEFAAFAERARRLPETTTALAVTRFVDDENPLRVSAESDGRIRTIGGSSGDAVTAGFYLFSERARRLADPRSNLDRLRDYLAWLLESGEPIAAIEVGTVVDVDRAADVQTAERLAKTLAPALRSSDQPITRSPDPSIPVVWGIYRELAHSPGRETDDAEILRATARRLEAEGFSVRLKTAEEVSENDADVPPFVFLMCERPHILSVLEAWERRGVTLVNPPAAVWNTYRDRMLVAFERDRIPFPESRLVSTGAALAFDPLDLLGPAVWVKRGDVHNTQAGDVVFARDRAGIEGALGALGARGIPTAILQRHVEGDLVKFYGIGEAGREGDGASWFEWFYHRDQILRKHPFDVDRLASAARGAAASLGLEIWGGDAIVTADGAIFVIDVNAWPSFALYRQEAAGRIAAHLSARVAREVGTGVKQ